MAGGWITINGTHVMVDGSGKVVSGPKALRSGGGGSKSEFNDDASMFAKKSTKDGSNEAKTKTSDKELGTCVHTRSDGTKEYLKYDADVPRDCPGFSEGAMYADFTHQTGIRPGATVFNKQNRTIMYHDGTNVNMFDVKMKGEQYTIVSPSGEKQVDYDQIYYVFSKR